MFPKGKLLAGLAGLAATTTVAAHPGAAGALDELSRRAPQPGVVITQCTQPGLLSLAYDDGPYQYTSELIDTLDAAGVKATFFWTGTLYGCIYDRADVVKKAYASGHQIASHTWTHPSDFGSLSSAGLTSEMQQLEQALTNIIGIKPAYMRPPYLATGGSVLSTMASLGYKVITDDVDAGDWSGLSVSDSEARFTAAGTSSGHIPLMHETYQTTVEQLTPWLIQWASDNGLKIVTVAECVGDTAAGAYAATGLTGNGASSC